MDIKIIIAVHKPYWIPTDPMYLPIHVGAEGKTALPFQPDNTGENISSRNPYYCELTGLYWAWKNLNAEYLGLVHYRRHFSNRRIWKNKNEQVISHRELESKLKETPVLLPKPRHYWIETNYSQYVHAHHAEDLELTRHFIQGKYPQYLLAYDRVMKKKSGHRFNMFVMKKELLDQYSAWLFDILFSLESMLDISAYNKNDQRVFGFVGERMLDVWIETNHIHYQDIPYVFLENQNWIKKGASFLRRKWHG